MVVSFPQTVTCSFRNNQLNECMSTSAQPNSDFEGENIGSAQLVDTHPQIKFKRLDKTEKQIMTMGYREGITEGKESSSQEGFNIGFRQSVQVGKKWGLVWGTTSAIGWCLPESSVEKLIPNIEIWEWLKEIQKAVQASSSDKALRIYQESIKKR